MQQKPIKALPSGYQPDKVIHILDDAVMRILERYNLYLIPPFLISGFLWRAWVQSMTDARSIDLSLFHNGVLWLLAVAGTLILHEAIHGLAMLWAGYQPRFGVFYQGKIPIALYATTDNGYFRRTPFLIMALAPLVVITGLCLGLMWITPYNVHFYLIIALVINGSGAAGDLYMSQLAWGYTEETTLILDHAEGVTIFTRLDNGAT